MDGKLRGGLRRETGDGIGNIAPSSIGNDGWCVASIDSEGTWKSSRALKDVACRG